MRIDALTVVGPNLFAAAPSVATAVTAATDLGLDAVVAAPGRPPEYALPPANDALAAEADGNAAVLRLGRVDPLQGAQAVAETRRCVRELGCVGIFLHPGEEHFPLSVARDVIRAAGALGAPVVVAAGIFALSEPLQFLTMALEVPEATIVMTSGGQINISGLSMIDAWSALVRAENLYVMSNGEYRQDFLERVATELSPRRLLFASFAPYFDQDFEFARVRSARFAPNVREFVEGGNAARLFMPSARIRTLKR
jgi:predicted TIM-barrel fold metal-dependent hydrolase